MTDCSGVLKMMRANKSVNRGDTMWLIYIVRWNFSSKFVENSGWNQKMLFSYLCKLSGQLSQVLKKKLRFLGSIDSTKLSQWHIDTMIWGLRFSFFPDFEIVFKCWHKDDSRAIESWNSLVSVLECYNNEFHSYQQPFSVNVLW